MHIPCAEGAVKLAGQSHKARTPDPFVQHPEHGEGPCSDLQ